MKSLLWIIASFAQVMVAIAQNYPVFLGRSTPPVPRQFRGQAVPAPFRAQTQFPRPTSVPVIPAGPGMPLVQQGAMTQAPQTEPWAPGEPEWFFPSSPSQWLSSCQRRGCTEVGTHCVFWGSLCPSSVRGVPCQCQRGCRVDTYFIPYGQSRVMDRCNNICSCNSREGMARCTTRRC